MVVGRRRTNPTRQTLRKAADCREPYGGFMFTADRLAGEAPSYAPCDIATPTPRPSPRPPGRATLGPPPKFPTPNRVGCRCQYPARIHRVRAGET